MFIRDISRVKDMGDQGYPPKLGQINPDWEEPKCTETDLKMSRIVPFEANLNHLRDQQHPWVILPNDLIDRDNCDC